MKNLLFTIIIFSSLIVNAQSINLEEFATGLTSPVEITNANDSRLFVVQQNGIIKIVQPNGAINSTNFLNISSKILFGGERGLLGLAFHPQYSTNGYFFVYYNNTAGNVVVARYTVNATDPNIADPNSEKILLNIPKPFDNHNGGSIHFAPDGKLWIITGDGGSGGDPNNNAQNKNAFLGKMLRIDVDATGPYNIPPDNPFAGAGVDGLDEIWAYGLRNAWKFSFDLTTGNAMIADVGQGAIEEINKMPITQAGLNYGWRCYEGNTAYNTTTGCPAQSSMTFPIAVYDHSGGRCSITGGYVYRGTQYPSLQGKYFFADYCSTQIGILDAGNAITWTSPSSGNNFSTFGQDSQKELYVAAVNSGKIFKITTGTLSTQETNSLEKISIYPNPATKEVFVKGIKDKKVTAEIISAEGRKVVETNQLTNGQSINISGISAGVYFINIKSGDLKSYSQKLIIKEK
ncbi:cadherin [Chryseobacterium lactis]|uniref:Cadherin n=1 Tax=Chryseobacterium lactis TaxID=1241981 RepID=A0A3G6RKD2_CHRLC|nr:PQQ-dependent sugar dehydrogenase [Chryseobacterium lactis]AZA83064.1 T9SS C-terminal target domain-containing protein [Chryseobacterium lactis]AZB03447.1 T9SS C-terminal target domain-containing protein [Chryseobacterium lactis]PNW12049.1 cadherin [Chryseobacterium lactis]